MVIKSLEDRVIDVVLNWANPVQFPVQITTRLVDMWGTRGDTVPFPDPATRMLITSLQEEFKTGVDARILTIMSPSQFGPGGVVSLSDLVFRVDHSPKPDILPASAIS